MHSQTTISVDGHHLRCASKALRPNGTDATCDLATCWGPEGVREANARRLGLLWNTHDELLAAAEVFLAEVVVTDSHPAAVREARKRLEDATSRARGARPA